MTALPDRRTFNGSKQQLAGNVPELVMPLVNGALTLTNELQAAGFIGANNAYIFKLDLSAFKQVRLTGRVTTASNSANTPIMYVKGHTAYSTTVGDYGTLSGSAVSVSLAATGLVDTGWMDISDTYDIDDCFLGLFTSGGDGAADPVVANVYLHIR